MGPAKLTGTAWTPEGDLPLDEWLEYGRRLGLLGRGVAWWIGDWLRYGNARYGEKYTRASRTTGYDTQSLMNMVYVASRFARERRRTGLSWSHHAEVAALNEDQQETWLDLAESQRLSVHSLRLEVRAARREAKRQECATGRASADTHDDLVRGVICPRCQHVIEIE